MRNQFTTATDGTFSGRVPVTVTTPGDTSSECYDKQSGGYQSPNAYPQYGTRTQLTQDGWDGTFVGIKIPSPMSTDGDGGGSQLGSFSPVSFDGFTRQNETSGPVGPDFSPSNGQPTNGTFPGFGDAGQGGFGRKG